MVGDERKRPGNIRKVKPPAFQFYADDFIGGTVHMTAEEVGGYIRLLCYQWSTGSIPLDDKRCAMIAGMAEPCLSHALAKFKIMADGRRCNERLEHERQKQAAFRSERAESGKKGAFSRWRDGSANSSVNGSAIKEPMAKAWQNDGSPSPSPSPSKDKDSRFAPPAFEEAMLEASKQGLPISEVEKFLAYYGSKGWTVGKSKMKDWRKAMTGWRVRWEESGRPAIANQQPSKMTDAEIIAAAL